MKYVVCHIACGFFIILFGLIFSKKIVNAQFIPVEQGTNISCVGDCEKSFGAPSWGPNYRVVGVNVRMQDYGGDYDANPIFRIIDKATNTPQGTSGNLSDSCGKNPNSRQCTGRAPCFDICSGGNEKNHQYILQDYAANNLEVVELQLGLFQSSGSPGNGVLIESIVWYLVPYTPPVNTPPFSNSNLSTQCEPTGNIVPDSRFNINVYAGNLGPASNITSVTVRLFNNRLNKNYIASITPTARTVPSPFIDGPQSVIMGQLWAWELGIKNTAFQYGNDYAAIIEVVEKDGDKGYQTIGPLTLGNDPDVGGYFNASITPTGPTSAEVSVSWMTPGGATSFTLACNPATQNCPNQSNPLNLLAVTCDPQDQDNCWSSVQGFPYPLDQYVQYDFSYDIIGLQQGTSFVSLSFRDTVQVTANCHQWGAGLNFNASACNAGDQISNVQVNLVSQDDNNIVVGYDYTSNQSASGGQVLCTAPYGSACPGSIPGPARGTLTIPVTQRNVSFNVNYSVTNSCGTGQDSLTVTVPPSTPFPNWLMTTGGDVYSYNGVDTTNPVKVPLNVTAINVPSIVSQSNGYGISVTNAYFSSHIFAKLNPASGGYVDPPVLTTLASSPELLLPAYADLNRDRYFSNANSTYANWEMQKSLKSLVAENGRSVIQKVFNPAVAGNEVVEHIGNLSIGPATCNGRKLVFVTGNLTITPPFLSTARVTTTKPNGCIFIVGGNVSIRNGTASTSLPAGGLYDEVDAFIIARGTVTTIDSSRALYLDGSLIYKDTATFERNSQTRATPAEFIKYQSKYLDIFRSFIGADYGFKVREAGYSGN